MIETPRLVLRPFRTGDEADLYAYLKEPQVNCFACMKLHTPEEAVQAAFYIELNLTMRCEGIYNLKKKNACS